MLTEENKAFARRIQEEFWDQKNLAVADELLALTYVDHVPGSPPDVTPVPAKSTQHSTIWSSVLCSVY